MGIFDLSGVMTGSASRQQWALFIQDLSIGTDMIVEAIMGQQMRCYSAQHNYIPSGLEFA